MVTKNINKFKTKAQMLWDVSKEVEKDFIESLPEKYQNFDTWEKFKLIRGAEYRRGKEDGRIEMEKEMIK